VTGADPKSPAKNLVIKIVCMSFAVAVPNEKHAARKYGAKTAGFLPYLNNKLASTNRRDRYLKLKPLESDKQNNPYSSRSKTLLQSNSHFAERCP
jgi:hypothetical protein